MFTAKICIFGFTLACTVRHIRALSTKPSTVQQSLIKPTNPLILLDVDGVLNHLQGIKRRNLVKKQVLGWNIHYSEETVSIFNQWHDSQAAEIRWLTAWNENANEALAPALGLREFGLAPTRAEERDRNIDMHKDKAAVRCSMIS
jgi:hypothetical protein